MTLTKDALISEVVKENGYLRNLAAGIIETLIELLKLKLICPDQRLREVLSQGEERKKGQESGDWRGHGAHGPKGCDVQVFWSAAG